MDGVSQQAWTAADRTMETLPPLSHLDHALLLFGLGSGALLQRILETYGRAQPPVNLATKGTIYEETAASPEMVLPVWVLEPDRACAERVRDAFEWSWFETSGQLRFFIGPDAVDQLEDASRDPWRAALTHFMRSPDALINRAAIESIMRRLQEALRQRLDRKRQLAGMWRRAHAGQGRLQSTRPNAVAWRERYAEGKKLKVLCIGNHFTLFVRHSTAFLARGFELLGHEVRVLEESDDSQRMGMDAVQRAINGFAPDIIVNINYAREFYHRAGCRMDGIPLCSWLQDPPAVEVLRLEHALAGRSELDFYFASFKEGAAEVESLGYGETPILHAPTNPEVFCPREPSQEERNHFGCEVTYVSTMLPETIQKVFYPSESPTKDALRDVMALDIYNRMKQRLQEGREPLLPNDYLRFVEEHLGRVSPPPYDAEYVRQSAYYLECQPARLAQRSLPVMWLLEHGYDVNLYGSGWERHPVLGPHTRGAIPYGPAMAAMLRCCDIYICNHGWFTLQMKVLDSLAVGTFPLVCWVDPIRDTDPITNWFKEDCDIVIYRTREEFLDKVRYYLRHPEERRRIVERGRAITLEHFTYRKAAELMLKTVRRRILERGPS